MWHAALGHLEQWQPHPSVWQRTPRCSAFAVWANSWFPVFSAEICRGELSGFCLKLAEDSDKLKSHLLAKSLWWPDQPHLPLGEMFPLLWDLAIGFQSVVPSQQCWVPRQQQWTYLGICYRGKFLGPTPAYWIRNSRVGPAIWPNKLPTWFW